MGTRGFLLGGVAVGLSTVMLVGCGNQGTDKALVSGSRAASSEEHLTSRVLSGQVTSTAHTSQKTIPVPQAKPVKGAKYVALTFDDGPSRFTPQVVSILRKYGVPGTFFEIGQNVSQYPQYTKMLKADGYPVENHTWDHPDLERLPDAAVKSEIVKTTVALGKVGMTPQCVRAPYGAISHRVLVDITSMGYRSCLWSDDSEDWMRPGVSRIVKNAESLANSSTTILFHDGGGDRSETVKALPVVIQCYKKHSYVFTTACGNGSLVKVRSI